MVLFEDTRQQVGKHKNVHLYCRQAGIKIIRQALNVGDYQIAGKGDISVDTKMGVLELAGNVFQEHERFRAECLRAQECGIQLIVLVEEPLPGGRLDLWRPPIGWNGLPIARFDPAILRRGRFDQIIEVKMPTAEEIESLLRVKFLELPVDDTVDIHSISAALAEHPMSDVDFVIREAGRYAAKNRAEVIDRNCFDQALDQLPKKKEQRKIGF